MKKNIKYIIIAFLLLSLALSIIYITCFNSADITAVYTRYNLSWNNTEVFEDGSIDLGLTNGKTTVRLKNEVKGNIGYNLYLYTEKEISNEVKLSAKELTEIAKNEYPDSMKNCDIKCAYRGYLEGTDQKDNVQTVVDNVL